MGGSVMGGSTVVCNQPGPWGLGHSQHHPSSSQSSASCTAMLGHLEGVVCMSLGMGVNLLNLHWILKLTHYCKMRDYSKNVNEAILGNGVILGTRLSWEWSSPGQSMKLSKAQKAYSQGSWNLTIFNWYTVLVLTINITQGIYTNLSLSGLRL